MNHEFEPSRILLPERRILFLRLHQELFPTEFVEVGDGLVRLHENTDKRRGLLFLINHEHFRDVLDSMAWVYSQPGLLDQSLLSAMAYHQYYNLIMRYPIIALASFVGVDLCSVVTPHTIKKWEEKGKKPKKPLGWGLNQFFVAAVSTLRNNGTVGLAPQSQHQKLDIDIEFIRNVKTLEDLERIPPTMGLLLAQLQRAKVEDFLVLFLGIQSSRDDEGELERGVPHKVLVGNAYTMKDVNKVARAETVAMLSGSTFDWGTVKFSRLVTPWVLLKLKELVGKG